MQEFWNFLLRAAGIVALVFAAIAAYYLVMAYSARRAGRSALFDAERQVSQDRSARHAMTGIVMLGLTALFFGLSLFSGSGAPAQDQLTPTPTRGTQRPAPTASLASPTSVATSALPTVAPPPVATKTPAPVVNTPTSGRKTAVVTGTADVGGLKLRNAPNGDIIDSLPDGTVLELMGEKKTEVGYEWQRVRDPKGREGWVAGQYLIFNP